MHAAAAKPLFSFSSACASRFCKCPVPSPCAAPPQHLARRPPEQQAATLATRSPFAVLSYRRLNLHGEYDFSDQPLPPEALFDMDLITTWQPPAKPGLG
jgi:hypothetical protein